MTQDQFLTPSDKALSDKPVTWLSKYADKFESCPIGMSFQIGKDEVKEATLRSTVSKRNSDSRSFRVITHEDVYEIYRKV